ncbi:MAG: hypothetical protein KC503_37475 [Myxococcales bacterium]|nr:hypothetical protein [Myxococcales bacterium]
MRTFHAVTLALLVAATHGACGLGAGDVTITTFGEAFIEQQIPAAAPDGEGVVDGYTIEYTKFLLALSRVHIAESGGAEGAAMSEQKIFDLKKPGPHDVVDFTSVQARRWDDIGADTLRAHGAIAGNASAEDVELMNGRGWVLYVEGVATKGAQRYTFRWGFTEETRYRGCVDADEKAGVVVPAGGHTTAQLTIHGDHLFFDDLASDQAKLRFSAFAAADTNGDNEVTLAELDAVDLTTLPIDQYGTGANGTVHTLRDFVTAQTRSLVHFQGEGHCNIR